MLVAAALVPDTALLVPGASGRTDVAGALRDGATSAVREAVADADRVLVVAPARPARGGAGPVGVAVVGQVRASLGAVGVPDALVDPPARVTLAPLEPDVRVDVGVVPGVPTVVALRLLAAAGRAATHAVEVSGHDAGALRVLGARLVAGPGRDALVVVGSASGRHGPDAPLADDPDAPAYDEALVADLQAADLAARDRVGALDPDRAEALAVTGWGPWQVLVGATGDAEVRADVAGHVLLGAQHVVGTWHVEARA